MAILTITEQQQNEKFLNRLLQENYSELVLSKKIKSAFLKKCSNNAIWLPGLSPIVQTTFIQALTLAIQDQKHAIVFKIEQVFKALQAKLDEENNYLKWQFQQSSKNKASQQPTIAQRLGAGSVISADYWLQTDDMINALAPLADHPSIYIHTPVTQIDASVEACVKAALDNVKKVAYVMVESNGHWTLTMYKKQADKIINNYYNPPGDGKCGDHVIKAIYANAQQELNEPLGYADAALLTTAAAIRQNTIAIIKNVTKPVPVPVPVQQNTVDPTKAANNKKIEFVPTTPLSSINNKFDALYHQWNALANKIIDDLANYSPEQSEALWNTFFKDAASNIESKTWDPMLFHKYQCSDSLQQTQNENEAEVIEALQRSLLVH